MTGNPTDPERRLIDGLLAGMEVDLTGGGRTQVSKGGRWSPARTVRADVLADQLARPVDGAASPRAALKLVGAKITGALDLAHAKIAVPMSFRRCWFEHAPDLTEAQAPNLSLDDCRLPALSARLLELRGDLTCRATRVGGTVNVENARIGGDLDLSGSTLNDPHGEALVGDRLTVSGSLLADNGFTAIGAVWLGGAAIGGDFHLSNATLDNPGENALNAYNLTVNGAVIGLDLHVAGEVSLSGAQLGQVNFAGATLANSGGAALTAENLSVRTDFFARNGFTATGELSLIDTSIGSIDLSRATLENPGGAALTLNGSRVGKLWLLCAMPPVGSVRLVGVRVGELVDHPESWPAELDLEHCEYDRLQGARLNQRDQSAIYVSVSVRQRLAWLERQLGGFQPQPYEQLAAVYRRHGQEPQARRVLLEKHRRQRATLAWPRRLAGYVLDVLIGYGYRNWLAAIWLLAFWLLGTITFHYRPPAPYDPGKAPPYHSAMHALDLLLPIIDLGHDDTWRAAGIAQWISYLLILAGWVLTTAVVAGLTRVFSRT
ncbi:MAG: hypothetical protein ACRDTM_08445 [Micromonosporaceae bacterium]